MCSPRAASSDSTRLALDVFALQRPGGRKCSGRECRLLVSGADWAVFGDGSVAGLNVGSAFGVDPVGASSGGMMWILLRIKRHCLTIVEAIASRLMRVVLQMLKIF